MSRKSNSFRPTLTILEGREVPSVTSVTLAGGILTVKSNNGTTNVLVSQLTNGKIDVTDDMLDKMVEINIKAPLRLVRLTVPPMIEQGRGGTIINVTSISGLRPQAGRSVVPRGRSEGRGHVLPRDTDLHRDQRYSEIVAT